MIQSKKETLEEVKTQIENNLAQQKLLIETTMENSMKTFFAKQEESKNQNRNELARFQEKQEAQKVQLEKQLLDKKLNAMQNRAENKK